MSPECGDERAPPEVTSFTSIDSLTDKVDYPQRPSARSRAWMRSWSSRSAGDLWVIRTWWGQPQRPPPAHLNQADRPPAIGDLELTGEALDRPGDTGLTDIRSVEVRWRADLI